MTFTVGSHIFAQDVSNTAVINDPDPKEQKNEFERFYDKTKEGYVHKSKIVYLDQLKRLRSKEIKNGYIFFDENFRLETTVKVLIGRKMRNDSKSQFYRRFET